MYYCTIWLSVYLLRAALLSSRLFDSSVGCCGILLRLVDVVWQPRCLFDVFTLLVFWFLRASLCLWLFVRLVSALPWRLYLGAAVSAYLWFSLFPSGCAGF
jgi:hypothetical protein